LEAITGIRPYRKSLTWEEGYAKIEKAGGAQFDPDLTSEFLRWMQQQELPVETNAVLLYEKIAAI
jgi:HD-GYP domain-containing protein (c-di-GMP phosphodiesterase class II)